MTSIRIGISTCPNDTFAFFPLLENRIETHGLKFDFELLDVQQLNEQLLKRHWDVAKASFHAALLVADQYVVFSSGSALGFGNGPLLLAAAESRPDRWTTADQQRTGRLAPVIQCPGTHTTATLLYKLFYPDCGQLEQVVFSQIMPDLERQQADFGVCIHEGRFTFQDQGLYCVEDLGQRWEKETGQPLPLGGILGGRHLGEETLQTINDCIHRSVQYALAHRDEALPTMRQYAQELADNVIWQHVDLYVNRWTTELGDTGKRALDLLSEKAVAAKVVSDQKRLAVIEG